MIAVGPGGVESINFGCPRRCFAAIHVQQSVGLRIPL